MNNGPVDDLLRAIAEGTVGATGDEFFQPLARHLAHALDMRYALVAGFAASKGFSPFDVRAHRGARRSSVRGQSRISRASLTICARKLRPALRAAATLMSNRMRLVSEER